MTYQEVLEQARTCMGKCHACPVCNGLACKNTVPGPGAAAPRSAAKNRDKIIISDLFIRRSDYIS